MTRWSPLDASAFLVIAIFHLALWAVLLMGGCGAFAGAPTYSLAWPHAVGVAIDLAVAGALGALLGMTELISRYRDEPTGALTTLPARVYCSVNMAGSVLALLLIWVFGWSFGVQGAGPVRWVRVMAAGLGAMALFRSSLFTLRFGNQDVGIGPSGVLQVILAAADRAVDRLRASQRERIVLRVMEGVDFLRARSVLPAYCFGLMQNLGPEEQSRASSMIDTIQNRADASDEAKARLMGLVLLTLVGEHVLDQSVRALKGEIGVNADVGRAAETDTAVLSIMDGVSFDKARLILPTYCMTLKVIPEADAKALAGDIQSLIIATGISARVKSQFLGIYLARRVGCTVLGRAVDSLGFEIRDDNAPKASPPLVPPPAKPAPAQSPLATPHDTDTIPPPSTPPAGGGDIGTALPPDVKRS